MVIKSQIKLQKFPQNSSETVTKETEKIEHDKKKKKNLKKDMTKKQKKKRKKKKRKKRKKKKKKKNLKKDMYPQKKDRKLLMI